MSNHKKSRKNQSSVNDMKIAPLSVCISDDESSTMSTCNIQRQSPSSSPSLSKKLEVNKHDPVFSLLHPNSMNQIESKKPRKLSKLNQRLWQQLADIPIPNELLKRAPSAHSLAIKIPSTISATTVTINPYVLSALGNNSNNKNINSNGMASSPLTNSITDGDKATQTSHLVSVGTECCSLIDNNDNNVVQILRPATVQKSVQTTNRVRLYKKRVNSTSLPTQLDTLLPPMQTDSSINSTILYDVQALLFGKSAMSQFENVKVVHSETQTAMSNIVNPDVNFYNDISIQTVQEHTSTDRILLPSSADSHNVNVQTLPIQTSSKQMQTTSEQLPSLNQQQVLMMDTGIQNDLPFRPLDSVQQTIGDYDSIFNDFIEPNDNMYFEDMDFLFLNDIGTQTQKNLNTIETQTSNWTTQDELWFRDIINT
ncbi:unnamed protein product [Didymodactylos carnosus]|uniref:Uncharacterized protein n=1 Tax=Didymodactylos carnosus TaxID=1234261 RepID=A0A814J415_9BILA|nr:unnamed protein product [Didymodactylos carnosus]CAF1032916.1 unnamed protein product [Didymodactylos carnosus]CAF3611798.1 unnamed protein product [Didymodactylos carnosus]CAF3803685.1 unnamed protein product [Didymodactylos carnosus]